MIRIMQNKKFEWLSFATWVLGLLGLVVYIIFCLVEDDSICNFLSGNKFLLIFISIFIIGVISSHCYTYSCKKDTVLTKEEITDCVVKAINKRTQIKIDESVVSRIDARLEDIQKQQSTFETVLYEKLESAFFTKDSNLKFLQNMASSISDKDSAWTKEQIERFLKCMESINDMMEKKK